MKIDLNNEKAEFACKVCNAVNISIHGNNNFIGCPWRHIDGEYCDELADCLASEVSDEFEALQKWREENLFLNQRKRNYENN